jgi:hypothetical protein
MPPTLLGSLGAQYIAAAEENTEMFPENVGQAVRDTIDHTKIVE